MIFEPGFLAGLQQPFLSIVVLHDSSIGLQCCWHLDLFLDPDINLCFCFGFQLVLRIQEIFDSKRGRKRVKLLSPAGRVTPTKGMGGLQHHSLCYILVEWHNSCRSWGTLNRPGITTSCSSCWTDSTVLNPVSSN